MLVLAIDTSTSLIVTGVLDYRVESDEVSLPAGESVSGQTAHGELLAPSIESVLRKAAIRAADLGAVVVGLGPGPFTGLRVGIVTASAMADVLDIPAYGVCSLDAVADHDGKQLTLVVSDARRKEIYYAVYDGAASRVEGPSVDKPQVVVDALRNKGIGRILNAGADKYLEQFGSLNVSVTEAYPKPELLLDALIRAGGFDGKPEPLTPLYLRRPDAKLPAAQGKLGKGQT